MDIIQLVAIGLVATVLAITLKNDAPEFAMAVSIIGGILLFYMVLPQLTAIIETVKNMAAQVDTPMSAIVIILKIVGVAYIAEFGAQLCADAGQGAIASKIEMGGKVLIMAMSIPIVFSVMDLIVNILPS